MYVTPYLSKVDGIPLMGDPRTSAAAQETPLLLDILRFCGRKLRSTIEGADAPLKPIMKQDDFDW